MITATTPADLNLTVALTGGGKQTLTGSNSYTGTLTLTSGILSANNSGINAGTATGGITFNGGTLQAASGGITTGKAVTVTTATGGIFDTNGNASTLSGAVTSGGLFTVANSSATAGSLTLSSASNTFSGGLNITDAGGTGNTVIDGNSSTKTLGAGTVTMGDNTTLDLGNFSPTVLGLSTSGTGSGVSITNQTGSGANTTLTLSNAASTTFAGSISNGTASSLALTLSGGTQTLAGANTYTGATTTSSSSTLNLTGSLSGSNVTTGGSSVFTESVTGAISGSGTTFTQSSSGTSILSGTNTYTGATTVTAGTLEFGKEVALYDNNIASWTASNIIVNSAETLALAVGATGDFTSSDISTLSALGSATGGFKTGSILGIDTTDGDFAYSGGLSNSNLGANALGLTKLGANTLTLTGVNIYTGATTVKAGTLLLTQASDDYFTGGVTISGGNVEIDDSNALADSVVTINAANGLTFGTGLGSATLAGLLGTANETLQDGSTSSGSAVNLLLGQYANTTFSSSSSYTGILSGTGSVTKLGSGTQTFGASNTYTGGTILNAANINLSNNTSALGTLATTLSGSGTPFGTGAITIDTGKLSFTPSTTGTTSLTAANATTGTQFTYAGGSFIILTQKDTSSPLTVTLGNSGATGSVLNRTNNGTLILQADASSTGAGSLLGSNDRLILNGPHPAVGNGTSAPAIVNPSLVTLVPATTTATVNVVSSSTSSPTVTLAAGALPVTFGTGDTFLGKTVSSISGSVGSGWTVTLSGNATTAPSGAVAYTSLAQGDFLTYDNTNGFEDASGAYTLRNGTIAGWYD